MEKTADLIDMVIRRITGVTLWLVMLVVFLQFFVVIFRYVFGINSIEAQETITILHGLIFMIAAAYVLQLDKHVRVDIFYAGLTGRARALVNLVGAMVFLIPLSLIVWYYSWPYVGESWQIMEGSPDTGLQVRYLQKSAILAFAALMGLQGISILLRELRCISAGRKSSGR